MFTVCLVVILALAVIAYQWSRRKTLAAVSQMNGTPVLPLIGHLYLAFKYCSKGTFFYYLTNIGSLYRYPICLHFGPMVQVLLAYPDHAQTVLSSPHFLDKSTQYRFLCAKGLFTDPGDEWKVLRKNLNNSFGTAVLNSFAGIFNEKVIILVENLAKYVGQGETDISKDITKSTLDTIFSTAFGINFDLQRSSKGDKFVEIEEDLVELASKRILSPHLYLDVIYRLTKDHKEYQDKLQFLRDLSMRVLETKLQDGKLHVENKLPEEDSVDAKKPQIFLDSLLDLAQKTENFSTKDIVDNLITIFISGTDTTATTLQVVMLMLAIHQDVQDRVFDEISQACPEKEQFVSVEDVSTLAYTEMVCKESLRLYPVVALIGRNVRQDIKLNDKFTIPAKADVLINLKYLHRNPSIWGPEADKFDPDRFLPENCTQRHPYAFLPFGGGIRNCIGKRYAWLSMKIFIVHVLRRYRIKTSLTLERINVKSTILTRLVSGCPISLEERN